MRELSRSPLGFRAIVRRAGQGPESEHLLRVCFLDPIAERGQERVIVDSFIEQVKLEQKFGGEHWVRIHEIAEIDEGAYAVSDFYPRTAQSLIDGKSRLDALSLKQVVLGVVDGLIALRDTSDGRAHGMLRPEFVLIDDRAGPGKWRVVLCEPGPMARNADELKRLREADLRGIARIAIGLVEHKFPRSLNKQIEVSQAWSRVAGPRASSWIAALNLLLDPELDIERTTLESVRDAVASIPAKVSSSKGKLIAVGAIGLVILLGAGAFVGMKVLSPPPVQETFEPVATDFTIEVWEEWIRADSWMRGLDNVLRGLRDDEADPVLREQILALCPKQNEFSQWNPRDVVPNPPPQAIRMLEPEQAEEFFIEAARKGDTALSKANQAIPRARRIVNAIRSSDATQHYARLLEVLDATGASGPLRESVENAHRDLAQAEVQTQDDLLRVLGVAAGGAAASEAAQQLELLTTHLASIEELQSSPVLAGHEDPVLAMLPETLFGQIHDARGENLGHLLDVASQRAREVVEEAATVLSVLRSAGFARVDLPTFREAIERDRLHLASGIEGVQAWRRLASDPSLHRLEGDADPLGTWRSGRADAALARLDAQLVELESLRHDVEEADRGRLETSLESFHEQRSNIAGHVENALRLAAIESTREMLVRERATLDASIALLHDSAEGLYADLTVSEEGLIDEIRAAQSALLWEVIEAERTRRAQAAEQAVRDAGGDRRALMQVRRLWRAQVQHLSSLDTYFAVSLDISTPEASQVDTTPLIEAFEAERRAEAQRFIASVSWNDAATFSILVGMHEPLVVLARDVAQAIADAVSAESQLNAWREPGEIESFDAVLGWQAADVSGLTAAYQEAIGPIRARVEAASRVSSDDAAGLLAAARDASNRPEVRWASYLAADGAGTPELIEQDVQTRDVLAAEVRVAADARWRGTLESRLSEVARARWASAMDTASSVDELVTVSTLRDRVGAAESMLSQRSRRHLLLVELEQNVRGVDRSNPETADAVMTDVVRGWLSRARESGLVADDPVWLGDLEGALEEAARGGAEFDASAIGPGTRPGMQFVQGSSDLENYSTLVYAIGGGRAGQIVLRRVREEPFGDDVWFMSETEMTVGQFAALAQTARRDRDWTNDRQGSGPSAWKNDRGIIPRDDWVEVNSAVFRTTSLFMPSLEGRATQIGVRNMSPHGNMPVQQVSDEIIRQVCDDLGLTLPPIEVWREAVEIERRHAGIAGGSFSTEWVSPMQLNVRDEMWKNQRDHEKNVSRGEPELAQWRTGRFDRRDEEIDSAWDGVNDGYLLFRYATDGGMAAGGQFRHLIGNVAEVVSVGGQWAVIGGSAMSPPSIDPLEPQRLPNNRLEPSADVGLRLALAVPADNLRSTVVRRVERVVLRSPYQWPP